MEPSSQEMRKQAALTDLSFLKQPNWLNAFDGKLNKAEAPKFTNLLVDSGTGIGECMDERKCITTGLLEGFTSRDLQKPKPAMVGGAAGWTTYFVLMGQDVKQAVSSTKKLYQHMSWGDMQMHIDDKHGELTVEKISDRADGCGFLSVVNDVASITKDLLKEDGIVNQETVDFSGKEIFSGLKKEGAKTVVLTGNHKNKPKEGEITKEARVVINMKDNKTLNRDKIYDENPAFLWDAWATTNDDVLEKFNEISGKKLNKDQFMKFQATVHLATGIMLDAVQLGNNGNVVMIN